MLKHSLKLCVLALFAFVLILPSVAGAAYNDKFGKAPITCYALDSGRVVTYDKPGGKQIGWIDGAADQIFLQDIYASGWIYGHYPTSRGRKYAYFKLDRIFADPNFSSFEAGVTQQVSAYRKSNTNQTIGTIYANDKITVVGYSGNRAQVVYPVSGGYKMGWIDKGYIKVLKGDVNGDGAINEADKVLLSNYLNGKVGINQINRNNADVNGDGKISLIDLSQLTSMLNNNPQPDNMQQKIKDRLYQLSQNVSGYKVGSKYTGSGQCRGFANKVYQTIFSNVSISGYTSNNYGASSYPNSHVSGSLHNFAANNTAAVKNLFVNAKIGSFIQMGRRYTLNSTKSAPSHHSAILYSVDGNGCEFYEANTDGKNTIKLTRYSWAQLADKNKGFTIYTPNTYVLK